MEVKFNYNSTDYYYKVRGEITQALVDQLAQKIVTGDFKLADLSNIPETIVFGDNIPGVGLRYQRGADLEGKTWTAVGVATEHANRICLTALTTDDTAGTPATEPVYIGEQGTSQTIFAQTATDLHRRTGGGAWSAALLPAAQTLGKSMTTYKSAIYSWWTNDYNYSTDDGATWSAAIAETGVYGVEYDNKLVVITAGGIMKWTDKDPATTAGAVPTGHWNYLNNSQSVVPNKTITGLVVWIDKNGDPAIYIGTNWGVYIFNWDEEVAQPFYKFSASDSFNCKVFVVGNGDLYFSAGRLMLRANRDNFTVETVSPGPDDVFSTYRGRWTAAVALNNFMIFATDNRSISTRSGSIWKYMWNQTWHSMLNPQSNGDSINAVGWGNGIMVYSVWGTLNKTQWQTIVDTLESPLDFTTSEYTESSSCFLYSPFMTGSLPTVPKIALAIEAQTSSLSAGNEVIGLAYFTNDSPTTLTTGLSATSLTTSGITAITFGGTDKIGLAFRNLGIRINPSRRLSDSAKTPVLHYLKLRWVPQFDPRYHRVLQLDLSGPVRDVGPDGQRINLETLAAATTAITMTILDGKDTVYTGRLKIAQLVRNSAADGLPSNATVIFEQLA